MSGDESFLARWSRRKRGAAPRAQGDPKPEAADRRVTPDAAAASAPAGETPPPAHPVPLPPIESIGAGSDIRAFLAAGVPADLTRAALRRAWSADPTIRDFIGLSENAWDFTAPGGVPGFGAVTEDEVRRLLGRVMGEADAADPARPVAETAAAGPAAAPERGPGPAGENSRQDEAAEDTDAGAGGRGATPSPQENTAVQHASGKQDQSAVLPRHGHGGALPK